MMLMLYVCVCARGGITQAERRARESLRLLHILLCCTHTQAAHYKRTKITRLEAA